MQIVNEYTKEVVKKHVMRLCDDCRAEIPKGLQCSVAKCEICKADLCDKCVTHEDESYGDYRVVYCKACWDAGATHRDEIERLNALIWNEEEKWKCTGTAMREKFVEEGGWWRIPEECQKCAWLDRFKDNKEPLCNYGVHADLGHPLAGKTKVLDTCWMMKGEYP